jgi:hypothetical protein
VSNAFPTKVESKSHTDSTISVAATVDHCDHTLPNSVAASVDQCDHTLPNIVNSV